MKYTALFAVPVLLILASCSGNSSSTGESQPLSPVDSLRTVVMDLHNEEMAKMGALKMLKRQVNDSLEVLDSASSPVEFTEYQSLIALIDSGTWAMNSWMRNWSEPDTTQPEAAQLDALSHQYESMERTSIIMRKAIEEAEKKLNP